MTNKGFEEKLEDLYYGRIEAQDLLTGLEENQLENVLAGSFQHAIDQKDWIAQGDPILSGNVHGQLVLDRQTGEILLREAWKRKTTVDFIYYSSKGDLEDFHILSQSNGFITSLEGRTTFCAVQASCEGIPTIVNVPCHIQKHEETIDIDYVLNDQSIVSITRPKYSIEFLNNREMTEGDHLSLNAGNGTVYEGKKLIIPSSISLVYKNLLEAFVEASKQHGPQAVEKSFLQLRLSI